MKQTQSLANDTKRKRRILLGTLIPLTVIGVALGTALPLTMCKSTNNNDAVYFYNIQDIIKFVQDESSKVFINDADAHKDWSASAVDDSTMIVWLNEKIDSNFYTYGIMSEVLNVIDWTYTCKYQFIHNVAYFSFVAGDEYMFISTKNANLIEGTMYKNGTSEGTKSGLIIRAGTQSGIRKLAIDGNIPSPMPLPDWKSGIIFWPNVKFPTGNPS